MNPNLNFAQGVPGRSEGTATGIIESAGLATQLVDAAALLHGAEPWTEQDERGLQQWFRDYLNWLETSKPGLLERATRNNHAVYYDVQTAAFALYTGDPDHARKILAELAVLRIDRQVKTRRQPAGGTAPHQVLRLQRVQPAGHVCPGHDGPETGRGPVGPPRPGGPGHSGGA